MKLVKACLVLWVPLVTQRDLSLANAHYMLWIIFIMIPTVSYDTLVHILVLGFKLITHCYVCNLDWLLVWDAFNWPLYYLLCILTAQVFIFFTILRLVFVLFITKFFKSVGLLLELPSNQLSMHLQTSLMSIA